ncbi:MAG: rhodanese-like domain-containing protein [Acholeplasmataceae bacterium]|jgi:phage shock protein E
MNQTKILKAVRNHDVLLLDVRTKQEYLEGYIPEAVLYPLSDILHATTFEFPKKQTIYVYCRSGRRSGIARKILRKHGYKVKNIGGILNWRLEIEKANPFVK